MHRDNLNNMMCLDIYLAYISDAEYQQVKQRIKPLSFKPYPLMSEGLLCDNNSAVEEHSNKEADLQQLKLFYEKYLWRINLEKILSEDYEALVLTDAAQTIQWVSSGFKNMTGYQPGDAIGRRPGFLQGPRTTQASRKRLKKGLGAKVPFKASIINYRKNGVAYICQVSIFPISDNEDNITHFLALEKEI